MAAPFLFTLASLFLYDDADERGDSLLALWPLLLVLAAALAIANLFHLRTATNSARVPAAGSARRHPWHLHVAAALGIDVWHLAAARIACWRRCSFSLKGLLCAPRRRGLCPRSQRSSPLRSSSAVAFTRPARSGSPTRTFLTGRLRTPPFPQLAGLTTPGPYLPEIDELLRYAQANIPFDDGIVLVPGEEPFYFATGRTPRFPVPFFDPTIDPYSPVEIASLMQSHNIRWLIVKRNLQLTEDPTPQREATLNALLNGFTLSARLHGYDIYRRR